MIVKIKFKCFMDKNQKNADFNHSRDLHQNIVSGVRKSSGKRNVFISPKQKAFFRGQKKNILIIVFVFLILGLAMFFVASKQGKIFTVEGEGEELKKPKEEEIEIERSPFSGFPCSDANDRAFGVILHQSPETMPLSGVGEVDIAIEGPASSPGGVTRLLVIYQSRSPKEVGSIRSVRPFFVDLSLGFDLVLASWGGCDSAVKRVRSLGLNWLDARVNPSGAFFRKKNPAPHNGFTSIAGLKKAAKELGMRKTNNFEGYKFFQKEEIVNLTIDQTIDIDTYQYSVKYVYDSEIGNYLRFWNGSEMIDANTNKQVFAKNVVLMKTSMGVLSPGVADVKVVGSGEAKIYQGGEEIKGSWKKGGPSSRLTFFGENNEEIKFIPGPIWIEIVSSF